MAIDYSGFALSKGEPRAISKAKRRKEDSDALEAAYRDVDSRDGGICLVTGRYTVAGAPDRRNRREHHHLHGRNVSPERVCDPANIITTCAEAHQLIEDGFIIVEGEDANKELRFHWREGMPASSRILVIKSRRWSSNE